MKAGDKVVCINNIHVNLTINKEYEIIHIERFPDIRYWIKDNEDLRRWYYSNRFIPTLVFIRKEKLQKLNKIINIHYE